MQWLALDIGGANLKAADGRGYAESLSFALWREPDRLTQALRELIAAAPHCDHLAVTMTGELADCFETKPEGVTFILDAVQQAADGRPIRVYSSDGSLLSIERARARPDLVAAANWHALARFAARFAEGHPALLIDVGSTTCDVIPLLNGEPASNNRSDTARLLSGELVYAGIERTPVCALVSQLPYRGRCCPIAREFFATTRDIFTLLGQLPEQPTDYDTADGRPATKARSRARLARMICADSDDFDEHDAIMAAESVAEAFTQIMLNAIREVTESYSIEPTRVILSGHGAFAAAAALERAGLSGRQRSLSGAIGPAASRCAPAHALAALAREAASE